jgi:hypothetical protein
VLRDFPFVLDAGQRSAVLARKPLLVFGLSPDVSRPKWRWHPAIKMIDKNPEVRVPAAGDTHHGAPVAQAAVRQHKEHVFAARNKLDSDLRVVAGLFCPHETQQARWLAAVYTAMARVTSFVLFIALRCRLDLRGKRFAWRKCSSTRPPARSSIGPKANHFPRFSDTVR